ncbi:lipopolysaccharide-induced tumor necrosis factor-alpha factor homolog isoform X2 [Symsagittifera roscoffensis]|uniref:lipopolysaccharide-induced tumor necrosis factor-alpha factor homolog isoform X2 n=1 Tax=Symsagittifera roscoffensis TaxID=84072 RepID=UPI00307B75CD
MAVNQDFACKTPKQPTTQVQGGGYTAAPPMNAGYPMPATVVMSPRLSFCRYPQTADCQSCRARVTTAVDYETSGLTWLICLGIFFIGFGCGCCLIPFFVNEFKKAVHRCPNCNFVMGQKDVF